MYIRDHQNWINRYINLPIILINDLVLWQSCLQYNRSAKVNQPTSGMTELKIKISISALPLSTMALKHSQVKTAYIIVKVLVAMFQWLFLTILMAPPPFDIGSRHLAHYEISPTIRVTRLMTQMLFPTFFHIPPSSYGQICCWDTLTRNSVSRFPQAG